MIQNIWHCPTCETHYTGGFARCRSCDGELKRGMYGDSSSGAGHPSPQQPSTLEARFLAQWHMLGNGQQPIREHRFHATRQWRFDFAWRDEMVAVECEGGVWSGGRHTRGSGFIGDCDKYNAAALAGWIVLRFTSDHLRNDPQSAIDLVTNALEQRQEAKAA